MTLALSQPRPPMVMPMLHVHVCSQCSCSVAVQVLMTVNERSFRSPWQVGSLMQLSNHTAHAPLMEEPQPGIDSGVDSGKCSAAVVNPLE